MATRAIRCIKTDSRCANGSRAGEERLYERMVSKGRTPLYPDDILWNFEKFLVGRDGQVVQRFSPDMTPEDPIVMESIKIALAK
ncbi:hypothetical protein MYA98_02775 [Salmonella sp. WGH-01]|nr:hypothetical protein MYA98_02775 [Salmonella sp. WGH-01]